MKSKQLLQTSTMGAFIVVLLFSSLTSAAAVQYEGIGGGIYWNELSPKPGVMAGVISANVAFAGNYIHVSGSMTLSDYWEIGSILITINGANDWVVDTRTNQPTSPYLNGYDILTPDTSLIVINEGTNMASVQGLGGWFNNNDDSDGSIFFSLYFVPIFGHTVAGKSYRVTMTGSVDYFLVMVFPQSASGTFSTSYHTIGSSSGGGGGPNPY